MGIKITRYVSLVLLLVWMGVIFAFSAQDGKDSGEVSQGVVVKVAEMVYPDYDKLNEPEKQKVVNRFNIPVRKTAHFSEFFLLGGIAFVFFATFKEFSLKMKAFLPFILGVIYSVTDEIHQLLVTGRACRVLDMCIDSAGVLLAVLIGYLIFRKTRSDGVG